MSEREGRIRRHGSRPGWLRRLTRPLVLLAVGLGLLLVAWVVGNPPTSSPDEDAHYVKALGTAYGQFEGRPVGPVPPNATPKQAFQIEVERSFSVPPRLALPPALTCTRFRPNSAACQLQGPQVPPRPNRPESHVGPYQPFLYLPLGLAARVGSSAVQALHLGRLAGALLCLVLVVGAARCARTPAMRLGLLVAITPMAVFMFASLTTNGTEIAGGLCFAAACLALGRGEATGETWIWWTVGGAVLCLSRGLGPAYAVVLVLLVPALRGVRGTLALLRSRSAWPAAAVVAVCGAACLAWNAVAMPHLRTGTSQARAALRPSIDELPRLFREEIGRFGWLDVSLPRAVFLLGAGLLVGLLVVGVVCGSWRERIVLLAAVAGTLVVTVVVTAVTQIPTGSAGQARYTMAVGVAVPLLAGQMIDRRRLPAWVLRALIGVGVSAVAFLQVASWNVNAHRYAVGFRAPWNYLSDPQWSPSGGWWPWVVCAALGSLLLALSGFGRDAAAPAVADAAAAGRPEVTRGRSVDTVPTRA